MTLRERAASVLPPIGSIGPEGVWGMWVRDLDGPPTLRRRAQVRVENVLGLVEGGMDPRAAVTQVAKSPWVCPQCGAKWVDVVRGSKNCPDCDKLWV